MQLENLRKIVENYNPINTIQQNTGINYASLIAVEQVLKKYQDELDKCITEYENHVSNLLRKKCKIIFTNSSPSPIRAFQRGKDNLTISLPSTIAKKATEIELTNYFGKETNFACRYWSSIHQHYKYDEETYKKVLKEDEKTKEFIKYYLDWIEKFDNQNDLHTNIGLCLDIFQNPNDGLQIVLSDRNDEEYGLKDNDREKFNSARFLWYAKELTANFYFWKDIDKNERTVHYKNDECKYFLNETQIANIYSTIKVDISSFPKEIQDEIKKYENYYNLKLHEQADADKNELKRMQEERLMKAYNKFKEVIEEINNLQMEVELEKIKLEDLKSIFFKNGGTPNDQGYIEIDNIFRNNMMLRMLDLSEIDLTNVDIKNMNFSGTNIHIDPQTIYNKDMTNVNASGVKFSPFHDSFDNVVLDGATITDWEAAINLEKIKSYNEQTIIPNSCKKEQSINTIQM